MWEIDSIVLWVTIAIVWVTLAIVFVNKWRGLAKFVQEFERDSARLLAEVKDDIEKKKSSSRP